MIRGFISNYGDMLMYEVEDDGELGGSVHSFHHTTETNPIIPLITVPLTLSPPLTIPISFISM